MGCNPDPGRREVLLPLACPGLNLFRPYRAIGGASGVLPLDLSNNVQTPGGQAPDLLWDCGTRTGREA